MTNGERIGVKTDEEAARMIPCNICPALHICKKRFTDYAQCKTELLEWLKREE